MRSFVPVSLLADAPPDSPDEPMVAAWVDAHHRRVCRPLEAGRTKLPCGLDEDDLFYAYGASASELRAAGGAR